MKSRDVIRSIINILEAHKDVIEYCLDEMGTDINTYYHLLGQSEGVTYAIELLKDRDYEQPQRGCDYERIEEEGLDQDQREAG